MEHRLKNKIVDRGISEQVATSILGNTPTESNNQNLKWVFILGSLGAGLMIVNYTQPLGIHSVGTMALCLSAGFLGYYLVNKFTSNKSS